MNWDAIEITHSTSGKKTSALLYPGGNEDKGTNIIRLDASLRRKFFALRILKFFKK